jgi:hypothetical protein
MHYELLLTGLELAGLGFCRDYECACESRLLALETATILGIALY